jgi:hypothetical protein
MSIKEEIRSHMFPLVLARSNIKFNSIINVLIGFCYDSYNNVTIHQW